MPWEEKTVEQTRRTFVGEANSCEMSFSALCRKYGITRATGYKWVSRYAEGEPMQDRSHCAFHIPNRTESGMELKILGQREQHPAWGARKIKRRLENLGEVEVPAASTIAGILKRNGCIDPKESLKHKPYQRFERELPNELWQVDFKGDFGMGNAQRCHPLTIIDDHSRYALGLDAKANQRLEGVQDSFIRAFCRYGLPHSILCDNGNPWGNAQCIGYTSFEVWLLQLDILPIHGRIMHPQTQGKDERFNQTVKRELLSRIRIEDVQHAQKVFDPWRRMYNEERPHEALNMDVPATHYKPSERPYPQKLPDYKYEPEWQLRGVNSAGFVCIHNRKHFLSEAFANRVIALNHSSEGEEIELRFGNFIVARYSVSERLFISKRIVRTEDN